MPQAAGEEPAAAPARSSPPPPPPPEPSEFGLVFMGDGACDTRDWASPADLKLLVSPKAAEWIATLADGVLALSDRSGTKLLDQLRQCLEVLDEANVAAHFLDVSVKDYVQKQLLASLRTVNEKLGKGEDAGYKKNAAQMARVDIIFAIQSLVSYVMAKAGKLPLPTMTQSDITDKIRKALPFDRHMAKAEFLLEFDKIEIAGAYPLVKDFLGESPRWPLGDGDARSRENCALAMGVWEGVRAFHKEQEDEKKRKTVRLAMERIAASKAAAAAASGEAAGASEPVRPSGNPAPQCSVMPATVSAPIVPPSKPAATKPIGAPVKPIAPPSPLPSRSDDVSITSGAGAGSAASSAATTRTAVPTPVSAPARSCQDIGAEIFDSFNFAQFLSQRPMDVWLRGERPFPSPFDGKLDFLGFFESALSDPSRPMPEPELMAPAKPDDFARDLSWWGVRPNPPPPPPPRYQERSSGTSAGGGSVDKRPRISGHGGGGMTHQNGMR